jgi:hypothetical protein
MRLSIPARLPSPPLLLRGRPKGLPLSGKEPNTLSDSVARMLAAPANILHEVGMLSSIAVIKTTHAVRPGAEHSCLSYPPFLLPFHI